jgi:hypothetical protein
MKILGGDKGEDEIDPDDTGGARFVLSRFLRFKQCAYHV